MIRRPHSEQTKWIASSSGIAGSVIQRDGRARRLALSSLITADLRRAGHHDGALAVDSRAPTAQEQACRVDEGLGMLTPVRAMRVCDGVLVAPERVGRDGLSHHGASLRCP
jgi:hypothetical protein